MSMWSRATDFIRDVFSRDQVARDQAAADVDLGDYPVDLFGNLAIQAMGHGLTQDHLTLNNALMARFMDYERMDEYPDCSAALNIYSDDSTVIDSQKGHIMWTECKDEQIRTQLDDMLHKRVKVDDEAWESIRMACKYGNCLRFDSRVWTDHGLVEIQYIEPGMQVVTHTQDGQYALTRVVKKYDNGIKPTFRVRTRHRELFLTADHRVLTERHNGQREWVEVKDLKCERYQNGNLKKSNSRLVLGTRMPEGRVPSWDELFGKHDPFTLECGEKGTPYEARLPSSPEPWFMRLYGFLLGDGWVTANPTNHGVGFALGEYPELNEYYSGLLQRFGMKPKTNQTACIASSKRLANVFLALGWQNGSSVKRVPTWVYALPEEHRKEFLLGFVDADGWITEPKTRLGKAYHFEISNYDLARDLKQLIDGLGLRSGNLRERTREPGFKIKGKIVKSVRPAYTLTFDFTQMDNPFAVERVVSIEPDGEHQVYDIEVEDESHSFVADGVVIHNCFEEILVSGRGVEGLNYLPAPTIRRLETQRGALQGFVQSFKGNFQVPADAVGKLKFTRGVGRDQRSGVVIFEPWRIVHMRLRSQRRRAMYGIGILEPARWVWRRLTMLEDAALISRLSRAPSRFAFYVDVGKMPPQRAEKYLDGIRRGMKKRKFVNPKTGALDLRFSPLSSDEDFFLPVRESREIIRADVLNTPQWTGVEDIEYFRNKLHAALMVPRAYLGYDENMPSRATLSQEDVRFCRSVLRLQKEYRNGMMQVCKVQLASQGIDPAYVDFKLAMTVPSSIFELAQLEVQNTRAQFAMSMNEMVSKHWILSKVFRLSDAEIEEIMKQRDDEMKAAMGAAGGETQFESAKPEIGADPRVRNMKMLTAGRSRRRSLEQDLFEGNNSAAQRRIEGQLDKILHENRSLANRLAQVQGFLGELKGMTRPQASQF